MSDMKNQCKNKKSTSASGKFKINFNQDYTSLSVVSDSGYKLFAIQGVSKVDEIFSSDHVDTRIAERLFSSSLVATVWTSEQNKLKICHFKKKADICEFKYPKHILSVTMNRSRLVVCLKDSIYIHNIRDMRLLHSIKGLPENPTGLCSLSLNSHLGYPISNEIGNIQIFDAGSMKPRLMIPAHCSRVAAMSFSLTGVLLATASEKGTVIRVFCAKNAQRLMEFRRGMKRFAQIVSLNFSICNNYVSASSNTETIHIFKIDQKAKELSERRQDKSIKNSSDDENEKPVEDERPGFMKVFSKAIETINPLSNVMSQDRAFAYVQLAEPGLRYQCVVTKLEKETRLLVACDDGFLYIYNVDPNGGECELVRAHDLRGSLYDITELSGSCDSSFTTSETENVETKENILQSNPIVKSSYAEVMKGKACADDKADIKPLSDINDVVEYSAKNNIQIFDDVQFPPVCQA
ncbi:CLUMA_CG017244, isoform A [Clunio marinus]|uniref:CLUMA_CG017244, isoform A n=1 Tax=Clunio marinus TaxID=568069 RepID=A0A1J1IV98_9DIPT|nr:CLUMA_CG017244, isoform A [Clunio marinus]